MHEDDQVQPPDHHSNDRGDVSSADSESKEGGPERRPTGEVRTSSVFGVTIPSLGWRDKWATVRYTDRLTEEQSGFLQWKREREGEWFYETPEDSEAGRRLADVGALGWGGVALAGLNPHITYEALEQAREDMRREAMRPIITSQEWYDLFMGPSLDAQERIGRAFMGYESRDKVQEAVRDAQRALKETWEAGEWYRCLSGALFRELLTGKHEDLSHFRRFLPEKLRFASGLRSF